GDLEAERKLTRRLAALHHDQLSEHARAVELYRRALAIDPDDLAAAEALADIFSRRGDRAEQRAALERVLQIARHTAAGSAVEAATLRELAHLARAGGDLERAAAHLEEAFAAAPEDPQAPLERADLAARAGDHEACAHWLEQLTRGGDAGPDPQIGEVF